MTIEQLLTEFGIRHTDVRAIVRLARSFLRLSIKYRVYTHPRAIADVKSLRNDASDLMSFARCVRDLNRQAQADISAAGGVQ